MPLYSNVFSLYREWPGVPSVQLKRNRLPVKVQPDCAPGGDRKGGVPAGEGAAADRLYDGEVFRCELWLASAS